MSAAGRCDSGRRRALLQECCEALAPLQTAIGRFTTALFGREPKLDETALSESLGEAPRILRRLRLENLWIVKKVKNLTQSAGELGNRAWSR